VRVLSRLFRRLFLEELRAAFGAGELSFFSDLAELKERSAFEQYLAPLRQGEWVVYAKRPFAGPSQVLAYLARYTHRVAISNNRLLLLEGGAVTFRWKDYRQAGKSKVMTLAAGEFIRRFLMHTLPDGFHRIRYYGLFANGHRAAKLAICRRLLGASAASAPETGGTDHVEAATSADETHICPSCGGRMITIETFDGSRGNRWQMHPVMRCDSS
jgi:hypothetical protein